jgi:hypothetical protein
MAAELCSLAWRMAVKFGIVYHEPKRNSYKCASIQTGLLSLPKLKP